MKYFTYVIELLLLKINASSFSHRDLLTPLLLCTPELLHGSASKHYHIIVPDRRNPSIPSHSKIYTLTFPSRPPKTLIPPLPTPSSPINLTPSPYSALPHTTQLSHHLTPSLNPLKPHTHTTQKSPKTTTPPHKTPTPLTNTTYTSQTRRNRINHSD